MVWLKKHKLLLLLLALVYAFYFFSQYQPSPPFKKVLGAKVNVTLIEEPQEGREPLLNVIKAANKSIHMEMYLLSDKQIIDALISEKEEGVDVKVMLEERPYGSGNINQRSKKVLEDSHIEVKWTNPAYALTHEKSVVIDGTGALILNQNMTSSAFNKNREYDIIDDNIQDAKEIDRMFLADWDRHSFSPALSSLVISPVNSRGKLTALINTSSSTIDIEMEIIQDRDIEKILSEKAEKTKIRIIIPPLLKIPSNSKAVSKLKHDSVEVRELSSPYIHAKLLLSDNSKAYTGSVNFSTQSMDQNRELGIIVTEADVIQKLSNSFENDWHMATPVQ